MNQRISGLIHLPGCGPVEFNASSVRLLRDPLKEAGKASVEQRFEVPLLRTVSIELQEDLVAYGGSQIEPLAHTRRRRHIVSGYLPSFQARHEAAVETHTERPGDHQQVTVRTAANGRFDALIE
jgi:hypothetical protein